MNRKIIFKIMIGALVGAAAGFLVYRFIGCTSGACFITRNPYLSTLYGAVLGGLISRVF